MFKTIHSLNDIRDAVAHRKEIRFFAQPNGLTLGCYVFMDAQTFDTVEALECRGIVFDATGKVVSRPLHKFFNAGEREGLLLDQIRARTDIAAIYDKIDGSMLATAWGDGKLIWRSRQAFDSQVVKLTETFLALPENVGIAAFAHEVAGRGLTAIFELTHPEARIVVEHPEPQLRLLHVRDNLTGAYVLLDPGHDIHGLIARYDVPRLMPRADLTVDTMLASLPGLTGSEGYVIQFANGDMAKVKSPWYLRLHTAASQMRERDIASMALDQTLDDLKGALTELGIDLGEVNAIESRVKENLLALEAEVDAAREPHAGLDQKGFAAAFQGHPLFKLLMLRHTGRPMDLVEFYRRSRLKDDFDLRSLVNGALAEALEG